MDRLFASTSIDIALWIKKMNLYHNYDKGK